MFGQKRLLENRVNIWFKTMVTNRQAGARDMFCFAHSVITYGFKNFESFRILFIFQLTSVLPFLVCFIHYVICLPSVDFGFIASGIKLLLTILSVLD